MECQIEDVQTITDSKKNGQPLISIVTVVFNGSKTLEQTILSVINQSYKHKEFIIIDGGSTDGSIDIIRKYAPHLSYWCSEQDNGIYDAMNKGIAKSNGDIIGIINSDDWYEDETFTFIAEQYENSNYNTVTHGILRLFLDDVFYSVSGNSVRKLRYDMIQHPTCFIPKRLYELYGDYDINYKYSADYDLILRYVNKGVHFNFKERILANFRIGGISSLPQADKEMYKIRFRYHLITGKEYFFRNLYLNLTVFIKKFL